MVFAVDEKEEKNDNETLEWILQKVLFITIDFMQFLVEFDYHRTMHRECNLAILDVIILINIII